MPNGTSSQRVVACRWANDDDDRVRIKSTRKRTTWSIHHAGTSFARIWCKGIRKTDTCHTRAHIPSTLSCGTHLHTLEHYIATHLPQPQTHMRRCEERQRRKHPSDWPYRALAQATMLVGFLLRSAVKSLGCGFSQQQCVQYIITAPHSQPNQTNSKRMSLCFEAIHPCCAPTNYIVKHYNVRTDTFATARRQTTSWGTALRLPSQCNRTKGFLWNLVVFTERTLDVVCLPYQHPVSERDWTIGPQATNV